MKCLIVDDDQLLCMIHKDMLSSVCDCDVAADGQEAIQLFSDSINNMQPYDFICMDIEMPVCNGNEALSKIREIETERGIETSKQVKIIMLSSLNDPKTVMDSFYKGITTYIVKPVTKNNLFQILKNFKIIQE